VTDITLSNTAVQLEKGETISLTATFAPEDATNTDVVWKSSDTSVATVSDDGVVNAIGAGTATITCTATDGSEVESSCTVTVPGDVAPGDVNNDGKVSLSDLMLVLNHVSGKKYLTGDAIEAADVDGNGKVNLQDLMKILNYVSGKIATLG
jgi:hypothetical protein